MGRVKPSSSREGDLASRQIRAGGHADCSQVDVVPVPWHRARGGRSGSSVTQTRVLWMPLVGLCLLGPRLPLLLQGRSIWRKKGPRGVSEPHCGREWGRVQGDVAVGVTPAPSLPAPARSHSRSPLALGFLFLVAKTISDGDTSYRWGRNRSSSNSETSQGHGRIRPLPHAV